MRLVLEEYSKDEQMLNAVCLEIFLLNYILLNRQSMAKLWNEILLVENSLQDVKAWPETFKGHHIIFFTKYEFQENILVDRFV